MMIKELRANPNPGQDLKFLILRQDWELMEEIYKEDYILFKEKIR
jgi:hypothetical protein